MRLVWWLAWIGAGAVAAELPSAGIANPGFELGAGTAITGWSWWSRDQLGAATASSEVTHGGGRAAHISYPGSRDWAFSSAEHLPVKAGQTYTLSGWVKVERGDGLTLAAVGEKDGKWISWDIGSAESFGRHDWKQVVGEVAVPDGVNGLYVRMVGNGPIEAWVDDLTLTPGSPPVTRPQMPKVEGFAKTRVTERLDRGLVALPGPEGIYLSWRLWRDDPAGVAFNVYRLSGGSSVRVNAAPITATCDLLDSQPGALPVDYELRVLNGGREEPGGTCRVTAETLPYLAIPVADKATIQKVGIGDLDGDGRYDYVLKTPQDNIDPYITYWQKSPDTYHLEARRHDGRLLWRHDLGWAIERGIWYSPYLVYDFNGDGKAEVAAKVGEGDPRGPDGRVFSGPEWVVVWEGASGREIARAPWLDRDGFGEGDGGYNLAARNQLAVGYLDGRTPCLIVLRGTYTTMKAQAWELRGDRLRSLWLHDSRQYGRPWRGQGAHFTHCADLDADGRDEIILGSAVLDDNGAPLWSTGRGHNDHGYLGDIDPLRPGLEFYYGMETAQAAGGMNLVEARTGAMLWGWTERTGHIHGIGMCADIDPASPGSEAYGADSADHKQVGESWLWSAQGKLLARGLPWSFGLRTAYWDADLQRELVQGRRLVDYGGGAQPGGFEGSLIQVADVVGDWREELLVSLPGELRIYTTPIPATDRRPALMQDPIYRLDTAMCSMGYTQNAMTSYAFDAAAPGLNLGTVASADTPTVRVVVSAPLDQAVRGTVTLTAAGATISPERIEVDVAPGTVQVATATLAGADAAEADVRATLVAGKVALYAAASLRIPGKPLTGVPLIQAEDYSGQGGGEVQKRSDKAGVVGQAFSHWDAAGHWLEWRLPVTRSGRYRLLARYSAADSGERAVTLDGQPLGRWRLPGTGGFGSLASEWSHATLPAADGQPALLNLSAGEHLLRLENVDGKGVNLDYLALIEAP